MEPVSRKELLERMREGAVTVLDVRPQDEFALGHVPGAVNIPLRALKRGSPNSIRHRRSSPTAAAHIACYPLRPSRCCAPVASRFAAWKTVFPNGAPAGLPVATGAASQPKQNVT